MTRQVHNSEDPAVAYHELISGSWKGRYAKTSFGRRATAIEAELARYSQASQHWLDAGCGVGTLTQLLVEAKSSVIAVDASEGMLNAAKDAVAGEAVAFQRIETIEELPFDNDQFDGVLCSSVVEYVPDPHRALNELVRVLRPEGHLIITLANRYSVMRWIQRVICAISSVVLDRPLFEYIRYSKNAHTASSATRRLHELGVEVSHVSYFAPKFHWFLDGTVFGSSILIISGTKREAN